MKLFFAKKQILVDETFFFGEIFFSTHVTKMFSSIWNLTPHDITVVNPENPAEVVHTFPASGHILRLKAKEQHVVEILVDEKKEANMLEGKKIAVVEAQTFTDLEWPKDLDLEAHNVQGIIVSMPVGEWMRQRRKDVGVAVYGVDSSPEGVVRDKKGAIVGTKRLVMYTE